MSSVCIQCGSELGSGKLPEIYNIGEKYYSFCGVKCVTEFIYPKPTKRTCTREGCNRKVQENNRLLCERCYDQGDNIGESDVAIFYTENRANWEEREQRILERIRSKVRVYSSRDMTQEELRELVPSLRDKKE